MVENRWIIVTITINNDNTNTTKNLLKDQENQRHMKRILLESSLSCSIGKRHFSPVEAGLTGAHRHDINFPFKNEETETQRGVEISWSLKNLKRTRFQIYSKFKTFVFLVSSGTFLWTGWLNEWMLEYCMNSETFFTGRPWRFYTK